MITYSNGSEVLVCDKKDEKKLLKEYFGKGGRDTDEYDREESQVVEIRAVRKVNVSGYKLGK